jgi:pimeloyl-ACP methyl ester carboxylesterase
MSGSILLGGMPYRSMHPQIVHPVVMSLLPSLLSSDVADFSSAAQQFPASCVADDFVIPEKTRLFWAGAVAVQHPLVRAHSLNRTQDESKFLERKKTFPFLVIHGDGDKHMYIEKVRAFMESNFGNVEFHGLEGVGHAVFYESPQFVNQTILKFVKRVHGSS